MELIQKDFTCLVGAPAGYGVLSAGEMLAGILKKNGYNIFLSEEYPSQIKGGHNAANIRASHEKIHSNSGKINILIALDELSIKMHEHELMNNSAIICDSGNKHIPKKGITFKMPFDELSSQYGIYKDMMKSTIGLGAISKLIGLQKEQAFAFFKKRFKKKGEKIIQSNIEAFMKGYDAIKNAEKFNVKILPKKDLNKMLISGNQAISIGAIKADCKLLSSYPMTPSTGIMEYFSQKQKSHEIIMMQCEDEISSINAALGASYAGIRSMAATSGGGFALMNESLSLAGSAEIPIVIILGQRPGPATGLPTRTEQGELKYAIHAGHGEFPKMVLAPGDPKDCYEMIQDAFNYSDKYQLPAIILTDKHLASSKWTMDEFNYFPKIERGLIDSKPKKLDDLMKYKRYEITKNGISKRTLPGTINGMHCSIGDEHDEQGYIVEEEIDRNKMMQKRQRKMESLKKELRKKSISIFGDKDSKKALIIWGSTKGAAMEALKKDNFKLIQIKILWPFPSEELQNQLGNCEKIIAAESNQSGQMCSLIKEHTNIIISKKLLKYSGRHITSKEILEAMK